MEHQLEFDYIICGGGTSGCAVAGRLAEMEGVQILVIEAGPLSADLECASMPGGWTDIIETDLDWNYLDTPSQPGKRSPVKLTRGKLLGGSSVSNGTACVRGSRTDFDDWKLPGWDGDNVFKYMSKAENFHSKDWFEAAKDHHGYDGPIHTEPHDVAPISTLLLQSFQSSGFPYDHDMFTRGDVSHGVGYSVRSHWQGRRSTGADYLLGKIDTSKLTVWTECNVDAIEFVERPDKLEAQSEIILSAGAYGSPAILMRSGCGPKAHLNSLGIKCLLDLPGVGQNLQDHLIVFMFYETKVADLTLDALLHHGLQCREDARDLWNNSRSGVLASIPFGICAFTRLDDRLEKHSMWKSAPREPGRDPMGLSSRQPHAEYFTTECLAGLKEHQMHIDDRRHIFGVVPELFAPQSRGTVTLRSANPLDAPLIEHNYLSHELDNLVLAEACQLANDIVMKNKSTSDLVTDSYPADSGHHTFTSHAQWLEFVKANATTCFHAAGTCKMGHEQDLFAVLNERLLVRGTSNLRVADCSIMPKLNGGHTQMPAYAIGEVAADIIKQAVEN